MWAQFPNHSAYPSVESCVWELGTSPSQRRPSRSMGTGSKRCASYLIFLETASRVNIHPVGSYGKIYRGTSLIRNSPPVGPYTVQKPCAQGPMVIRGGWVLLMSEAPLYSVVVNHWRLCIPKFILGGGFQKTSPLNEFGNKTRLVSPRPVADA